jgi:hypothetical protein
MNRCEWCGRRAVDQGGARCNTCGSSSAVRPIDHGESAAILPALWRIAEALERANKLTEEQLPR